MSDVRTALEGIESVFHERWSPRAFDNSPIDDSTLARIFEAARWSPSCFNEQPWRFYTSTQATFDDFLGLLVEGNRTWAKHAPVIGFLVGEKLFKRNGKANSTWELDCGAAWMAMSLQARAEGLYTHGMAGIDHDGAAAYLELDTDSQAVLMGFVIGAMGDPADLPDELREREVPSDRMGLDQVWLRP